MRSELIERLRVNALHMRGAALEYVGWRPEKFEECLKWAEDMEEAISALEAAHDKVLISSKTRFTAWECLEAERIRGRRDLLACGSDKASIERVKAELRDLDSAIGEFKKLEADERDEHERLHGESAYRDGYLPAPPKVEQEEK